MWVGPPQTGGPRLYEKGDQESHQEQASEQHALVAFTSALTSRSLPSLTSCPRYF